MKEQHHSVAGMLLHLARQQRYNTAGQGEASCMLKEAVLGPGPFREHCRDNESAGFLGPWEGCSALPLTHGSCSAVCGYPDCLYSSAPERAPKDGLKRAWGATEGNDVLVDSSTPFCFLESLLMTETAPSLRPPDTSAEELETSKEMANPAEIFYPASSEKQEREGEYIQSQLVAAKVPSVSPGPIMAALPAIMPTEKPLTLLGAPPRRSPRSPGASARRVKLAECKSSSGEGSSGDSARSQRGKGAGRERGASTIKAKSMTERQRRNRVNDGLHKLRVALNFQGDIAAMVNSATELIQMQQNRIEELELACLKHRLISSMEATNGITNPLCAPLFMTSGRLA